MGKPTKVLLDSKAREAIHKGVMAVYEPVRRSMGPSGRNALLYRTFNRGSRITNDGVTISEVIEPKDEFENLVATTVKESARLTNQKVGDGTTATIVVLGALESEVHSRMNESSTAIKTRKAGGGMNVVQISKEIIAAAEIVESEVKKEAKTVKTLSELEKIATISVEDSVLGKKVAEMAWEVGIDGYIDVVEGYKGEIETELVKGMRFPAKIPAKAFVNKPERYEMVAQDCPVVITNHGITNAGQISAFSQHLETNKLIIFAPSFSDEVLVSIVATMKGQQPFFIFPVVTASLRTDQYEDLATYCDAVFVNKEKGGKLENIRAGHLGFLEKLVVKDAEAKEDAIATGGRGALEVTTKQEDKESGEVVERKMPSKIAERIDVLKGQHAETRQDQFKKLIERRIANMASAVGIIRVGGTSQADILYWKHKIEDAVYASKAALRGGYVKGGGLCLKEIAERLPESILTSALKAPYEQIQENAGGELEIGKDVLDAAESQYMAVRHAAAVIAKLITVEMLIPEEKEKGPGEGYEDIAKAITFYARLWGQREGLIKASENEVALENAAKYEEMELNGRD